MTIAHPNTQSLDTLANELWNFLGDAADHDLPPLYRVQIDRGATDPGWRCVARVDGAPRDSAALYDSISTYGRYWGVEVRFGEPYDGSLWPSGQQRQLTVEVSYAGVAIELYALVDGAFEPPVAPLAVGDRVRTAFGRYGVVTRFGCGDPTCIADVTIRLDDDAVSLCWASAELTLVKRAQVPTWAAALVPGGEEATRDGAR